MYRLRTAAGAAALTVALTSCGGSDKSPATSAGPSDSASVAPDDASPSASASKAPDEVEARPYFAALAKNDPTAMTRANKNAAPGSLAKAFMIHQVNGVTADLDGGTEAAVGEMAEKGDGFEICTDDPESGETNCFTYDKIKVTPGGQLASFSVNNKPLAGRVVVAGGKTVDSSAAKVTVLSAYKTTVGDYLTVAIKLRTKKQAVAFFDPVATYRAPNGQQRAQSGQTGLTDIGANSQSTRVFYFKGPLKFGGSITLQLAPHTSAGDYGAGVPVTAKVG